MRHSVWKREGCRAWNIIDVWMHATMGLALRPTWYVCRTGPHKFLCRMLVLLVEAGLSTAREFCGKTPPKEAAEPRDCPCRPGAPKGLGLGFGFGFGLGSGLSGPRCKVEIDHTRPAQNLSIQKGRT